MASSGFTLQQAQQPSPSMVSVPAVATLAPAGITSLPAGKELSSKTPTVTSRNLARDFGPQSNLDVTAPPPQYVVLGLGKSSSTATAAGGGSSLSALPRV